MTSNLPSVSFDLLVPLSSSYLNQFILMGWTDRGRQTVKVAATGRHPISFLIWARLDWAGPEMERKFVLSLTVSPFTSMPSRSPRQSARHPLPTAAEPPPGLFPAREDLVRLLAVIFIAAAAAAACSVLNRRPEPFCDSPQWPDDYADGTAISFYSFFNSSACSPCSLFVSKV